MTDLGYSVPVSSAVLCNERMNCAAGPVCGGVVVVVVVGVVILFNVSVQLSIFVLFFCC